MIHTAIRQRFPGWFGLILVLALYGVILGAILLCLDAPDAPFAYGNL